VLAASGDAAAGPVALAVVRGRDAAAAGVALVSTEELAAVPVTETGAVQLAAHVGVHDGTLVVVGDRFGHAACETIAAIAGQGTLALQNAALLRRVREGYASPLRRSS
jgi:hypothetical protein